MSKSFNNLVDATNYYIQEGYTDNLSRTKDLVISKEKHASLKEHNFTVDAVHRFEGQTNPADSSVLYAISSKDGKVKGLLVDAYGVYEQKGENSILQRAERHPDKE